MSFMDFFWIVSATLLIGFTLALSGCDTGGDNPPVTQPTIDYSYMLGMSYNLCGLYQPTYKEMLDKLAEHKINATRIFMYAGWGDNYMYKPWNGNDCTSIDPNYIQQLKNVVNYANSKGIIVILSMFHTNSGDQYNYVVNENGQKLRVLIQAIVNATMTNEIIFEPLNENVDSGFAGFVQSEIRLIRPNAKTSFYSDNGGTYRSEHTAYNHYIGGGRIHSTDDPKLVNLSDSDMFNIASEAKQQNGHTDFLVYFSRNGQPCSTTAEQLEKNFGAVLDLLKTLRS